MPKGVTPRTVTALTAKHPKTDERQTMSTTKEATKIRNSTRPPSGIAPKRSNGKGTRPRAGLKRPRNGESGVSTPPLEHANPHAQQIFAAVMAFRDGDFSVRLPTDWAGTDGRIAEAFNQAIGA